VARRISLPPAPTETVPLASDTAQALRLIARRTWRFFETFVGPEDHALPPDNLQEEPRPVVAHRTSPTNLGLYLLSIVAARDFGWLGLLDAVGRLEETLATMGELERFQGHFYNWYDTREVRFLEPRYISTVDSGNLAGHLLVLAEACRQLAERPLFDSQVLLGIGDAVALIRESAPASAGQRTQAVTRRQLDEALAAVSAALETPPTRPTTPLQWAARLDEIAEGLHAVVDVAQALAAEQQEGSDAAAWAEVLAWAELAQACVASHAQDVDALLPWARLAGPGSLGHHFAAVPALAALPDACALAVQDRAPGEARDDDLAAALERCAGAAGTLLRRLAELARVAVELFTEMEFGFLFDPARKLFSIGYRVAEGELDASFYDLLASEARLASFIAIAKGEVPAGHWFQLGRPLTPVYRGSALISWSGSMFEYLMPALVMRSPAHSLLDQTCRLVVRRQIRYGAKRGVPWGVSESAFNGRDLELTYQYSNFGVPGLGLKRGLSEDLVVAPYATALAAMFEPEEARRNFARLERAGGRSRYGFYEAIDYTSARLPDEQDLAVVRAYMAHHQGMTLVA
jgi:cyclic beta-1,2-glucan synthetase